MQNDCPGSPEWCSPSGRAASADVLSFGLNTEPPPLDGAVGAALPPRLTVDLSGASDRVLYAAQLYQPARRGSCIASGGALRKGPAETYAMAALLTAWGVPQEAIMLETASRNTYENAINSKRLLEAHGLHQVLLVTSALHMPRALALFRALGIDAGPAPTDFEVVESGG